jgi:hypothetical protein
VIHYPAVTGRRYEQQRVTVEQAVRGIMERNGWHPTRLPDPRMEGSAVTIEAEARTLVFGFVSDVAIRLRDDQGRTYVDMRSASRTRSSRCASTDSPAAPCSRGSVSR